MAANEADHVGKTVGQLAELHRRHRDSSTRAQRLANRLTRLLGRPGAIAIAVMLIAAWVLGNLSALRFHLHPLEPAPFPDLALALGVTAVVVALLILSTQQHGEELAERRAELTLQMALISERKVAKIIALLEEQRVENPLLSSRHDPEAEQMSRTADAGQALERLDAARPGRT